VVEKVAGEHGLGAAKDGRLPIVVAMKIQSKSGARIATFTFADMTTTLVISPDPIDEAALVAGRRASAGMGAAISFAGIVRGLESSSPISAIDYEAFQQMAEHQFGLLFQGVGERWPTVESIRLVHRTGVVRVGEASLWVEVVSPHRGEAFAACQWLIDEMKRVVPIWKKPIADTGS
jgi:molybdopterin synthase catalytic subunit